MEKMFLLLDFVSFSPVIFFPFCLKLIHRVSSLLRSIRGALGGTEQKPMSMGCSVLNAVFLISEGLKKWEEVWP